MKALKERADTLLTEMERQKTEAGDLYRIVTATTTAGGYSDEADQQKKEADTWRRATIGVATAAAAVSVVLLMITAPGGYDAGEITTKVLVALLIGGAATYAARQSGQHRQREQEARRLAIEIAAFGPFTESLADDAIQARKDFVRRVFVGHDRPAHPDTAEAHRSDSISIPKDVLDVLAKVLNGRG